ncbi:DUF1566 domain-containing protein [Pseudomonas extremaustralis]|uniref:DUF1566 domain-containing protein n=1 Tax=Pseudomonas extremaustralis TaxID=359110 RepID=UPI002861085E|nr:DUF1566 domain-containing protein [Pseudomonas extremaustralis]MDR6580138.1 hypothetical protein [Pseudomonas extremaustralis]
MTITSNIPATFGSPFMGGFYAGRLQIHDAEYALIVSPRDTGTLEDAVWGKYGHSVDGARSYNDGLTNTIAMKEAGSKAAEWALQLNIAGYTDWYLPSRDELELCYRNLKPTQDDNWASFRDGDNPSSLPVGYPYTEQSPMQTDCTLFQDEGAEAFDRTWHLSSTQYSPYDAWIQYFDGGYQSLVHKATARRARAVRRFKVTP